MSPLSKTPFRPNLDFFSIFCRAPFSPCVSLDCFFGQVLLAVCFLHLFLLGRVENGKRKGVGRNETRHERGLLQLSIIQSEPIVNGRLSTDKMGKDLQNNKKETIGGLPNFSKFQYFQKLTVACVVIKGLTVGVVPTKMARNGGKRRRKWETEKMGNVRGRANDMLFLCILEIPLSPSQKNPKAPRIFPLLYRLKVSGMDSWCSVPRGDASLFIYGHWKKRIRFWAWKIDLAMWGEEKSLCEENL